MVTFLLMPMVSTTVENPISHKLFTTQSPKYRDELAAISRKETMPYGLQPVYLVAMDASAPQIAVQSAHADNTMFPADIDQPLGGDLATFQAELESHKIPSDWMDAATSYKEVLRLISGICAIGQVFTRKDAEMNGGTGDLFPAGVTMSTTYSAMPTGYKTALLAAVDELGYSHPVPVPAGATLRGLLRLVGQQSRISMLGIAL